MCLSLADVAFASHVVKATGFASIDASIDKQLWDKQAAARAPDDHVALLLK